MGNFQIAWDQNIEAIEITDEFFFGMSRIS